MIKAKEVCRETCIVQAVTWHTLTSMWVSHSGSPTINNNIPPHGNTKCMRNICSCVATCACISKRRAHVAVLTHALMCPHMHKHVCININFCTNAHKQCTNITRAPPSIQSASRSCSVSTAGCVWVFCPGRETWTGGNTLTGSPGVLTRVRAAKGKEWLWEAVAPLSSLSTDYEAGPRRVPLGTPQATHSLPLLCYRICRWGIRLKCEEGCMWETCLEF